MAKTPKIPVPKRKPTKAEREYTQKKRYYEEGPKALRENAKLAKSKSKRPSDEYDLTAGESNREADRIEKESKKLYGPGYRKGGVVKKQKKSKKK